MDLSFIVIDDSDLDCFIAKKIIEQTKKYFAVKIFRNAKPALELIRANTLSSAGNLTIILLDLHMPLMNGFQFVEDFETLSLDIQEGYKINILSSTRNKTDIHRLLKYKKVSNFIEKPLTKDKLSSMLAQFEMEV